MDIIVTTPKSEMANAAREAADCIAAGKGWYFRRFAHKPAELKVGSRLWYVEDGFLRGYCEVVAIEVGCLAEVPCATTGRHWPPGTYAIMDARTWTWIKPAPMKGFQGHRYFCVGEAERLLGKGWTPQIVGGWRDPKPPAP